MYVVSGFMRTGTSAMMGALIRGGLTAHYDDRRRDFLNGRWADPGYTPNENYYEPSGQDFARPDFPRGVDGNLIKVLFAGLPKLAPLEEGYRVVFMWRDPEEIHQSLQGFFHRSRPPEFLREEGQYELYMSMSLETLRNRRDLVSLHEFRYREDLIADPLRVFTTLRDGGWDIDPEACGEEIDSDLCRFKLEELVVGV